MKALYKITYFNTQRFPYAQIGLGGNTLVTGTNGVGKTTTAQTVLFFYGSTSREKLGIPRNENKDSWLKYTYPDINSYVFYQYSGVEGDILLMTYPAGNKIAYRFAMLQGEINLREIVLKDSVPKEPKDLFAALLNVGLKLSPQITSPSVYRKVLYGDIDIRKEKNIAEFAPYALMKAQGNYSLIPDVLSSIFLNSNIDSGSIENAIASISSRQTIFDISQLREQVQSVTESFDALMIYDTQKGEIAKILEGYSKYHMSTNKAKDILVQLYTKIKRITETLPTLSQETEEKKNTYDTMLEEHNQQKTELLFIEKEAGRKSIESKSEVRHAQNLKAKYNEEEMQRKAKLVESLEILRNEHLSAQAAYDSLAGEHQDLQKLYDSQIAIAKSSSLNAQNILNTKFETDKKRLDDKIELEENKRDEAVKNLEESEAKRISALLVKKNNAWSNYLGANEEKNKLERSNPFADESNRLLERLTKLNKDIAESKNKIIRLVDQLTHNSERQEEYRKSIEKSKVWAKERTDIFQDNKKPELKNLENLSHVETNSVLGFIRENIPGSENIMTAVIKDEILLREDLNPIMGDSNHTLYGMSIDTELLSQSEYSHEAISEKIKEIKREIDKYKAAVEAELELEIESISQEEKKLRKEYFSSNEEKSSLENLLMHNERDKIFLQEQHEEKLAAAITMWEDAKMSVSEHSRSLKSIYDAIEAEYNNAQISRNHLIIKEKEKFFGIIEAFKTERHSIRTQLEKEIQLITLELQNKITQIEKERLIALENGGISKEELAKTSEALKKAKDAVDDANKHVEAVAVWRNDKIIFDLLPALIQTSKTLDEEHRTLESEYLKEKANMELKERRLSEIISTLESKIADFQLNISVWHNIKQENRFRQIITEVEQSAQESTIETDANALRLSQLVGLELEKAEESYEHISTQFSRFVSKLGKERFLFFKYNNSTKQSTIDSAKNLKVFIEEGGLDTTKELIAKEIRQIQGNVSERYGNLHDDSEKIKSLVQKINKVLKNSITNIPVLQGVEMRYERSEHKILADIEAISSVDIPYGDYNSLFSNAEKSKKSSNEILRLYKQLIDDMGHEKRDEITVKDTFEVQFKVIENGNDTGWVKSRKEIGSKGTSIIIKTLTYVALLDTILSMTRKNSDASVHVLLDEIGTLSQGNMREIIKLTNECGIILFNAAPDSKLPHLYDAMYRYELVNTKTKIILAAIRK